MDECAVLNECDQLCDNTVGSFRCSCHHGYALNLTERKSCSRKCISLKKWKSESVLESTFKRNTFVFICLFENENKTLLKDANDWGMTDYFPNK